MTQSERGLPIAAYFGVLAALALAVAFVAVLAIVIWLPPRPPDVMRSDDVVQQFEDGYEYMLSQERLFSGDGMVWSVRQAPPDDEGISPYMLPAQLRLARSLDLGTDQVRIAAQNVVPSDTFVFRVRDVDELRRHADEVNREVQDAVRDAEQATRDAESEARDADRTLRELESELRTARGNDAEEFEGLREATIEAADEVRVARDAVREARETERRLRIESARVIVDARATDSPEAETISTFEFNFAPLAPEPPAPPVPPAPGAPGVAPAAPAAPAPPPVFSSAPPGTMLISSFEISAELPDGRWLVMRQGRNWAELGWIGRAALVLGCVLTILFVLALLIARRLTLPIRNFSEAVQAVGVDPQNAPVREEGPRELRGAARAVNAMQARLRSLIADRTKTLAAVAHDMRTPLMRLRLAAENTLQRERMGKEIDEVEALVASFIAFARDDPAEEARVRLDIAALLQSIADDHVAAGHNVRYSGDERLVVTGQSLGLKRLFNNLIENALKYGSSARIAMRQEASGVVVDIEDDGPGVPADQRESVFEAFVRLESGEIKGAGLGLPAARSIARAHGGDVAILDGERGALVRVTLPG